MRARMLLLILAASVALWCAPADAVQRCRATVNAADGTIYVSGRDVQGVLTWGDTYGAESQAIFNYPACVTGGKARKCVLGDVGTPERTTTPPSCSLFLNDGAGNRCETFIRRCTYRPPTLPCTLFPADNIWNANVSALPVHAQSAAYIASIGSTVSLKADFGAGLYRGSPIGIPFTVVPSIYPRVPVEFLYADESDPGPYPISPNAPIEGGTGPGRGKGDRHILIVEAGTCTLFEVFDAHSRRRGASWKAGSGAVWDLDSHALRPVDWTSADAAGLPILPGLARYDEIVAGSINHALRFTTPQTQRAYVWPGRHFASSSTDPNLPPMGIRVRLKAGFDISTFSATNQIILTALKKYGMELADNGSAWFVSGTPDSRWDNDDLRDLARVKGDDFEVVDVSSLIVDPDSGQVQ